MAKIHFRPYTTKQILLFPQRIDENIAEDDPVRLVNGLIDQLDLTSFRKLYKEAGRSPFHPRMMLKAVIYGYMNNVYSCRKIEERLVRDVHFIWLSGYEHPDYITINRFRNRVKKEINAVFTQVVLLLAERGFVSLDVEYIDGTKIESKAHLREGTRTPLQASHRARGSIRADEIRHALQALPSLRQGQGHYGLCLLRHGLQHQENDCHNEKGSIKAIFMLFFTLYRGQYNSFMANLAL